MMKRQLMNPFTKSNPYFIPQSFSVDRLIYSFKQKNTTFTTKDSATTYDCLSYNNLDCSTTNGSQLLSLSRYYHSRSKQAQKQQTRTLENVSKIANPFFRRNLIKRQQKQAQQQCVRQFKSSFLPPFNTIANRYSVIAKTTAVSPQTYFNIEQILVSQGIIAQNDSIQTSLYNGKRSLIRSFKKINSQKSQKIIRIPSLGLINTEQTQTKKESNKSITFKKISQQQPQIINIKGKPYYKKALL